jgi:CRISPR-associated protein Csb2
MPRTLLLSVRFLDGRYHGRGQPDWPPSPARLFQALLAAAAKGATVEAAHHQALDWLEGLAPPVIVVPPVREGAGFVNYVPNNNLDAVGRDPGRIAEIRIGKTIKPLIFDAAIPLLYAWTFVTGEEHAQRVCAIADGLYQLGRGVDMAWAVGEVIDEAELPVRIEQVGGRVRRPSQGGDGERLLCPQPGSLDSLTKRYEMTTRRFSSVGSGRRTQQLFTQAPKPRFVPVSYDSPAQLLLYELREDSARTAFAAQPLSRVVELVERVRDAAAARLREHSKQNPSTIDRVFIGRDSTEADKTVRIRIVPLPSIGSIHVVRSIRRILVEVPPDCPLSADDVSWAFSGVDLSDPDTGEVGATLVPASDDAMLGHYGIKLAKAGRIWRTVTAAALPENAGRRRIDPVALRRELREVDGKGPFKIAKGSRERLAEEGRAVSAVRRALRHAGFLAAPIAIAVQREPFEGMGARAEEFAKGTRFAKERLWHVEIQFGEAISGPVMVGDGRYLGLGLMAPNG